MNASERALQRSRWSARQETCRVTAAPHRHWHRQSSILSILLSLANIQTAFQPVGSATQSLSPDQNMSLLPQYQRLPDTQISPGEFTSSKDTRLSFEDDEVHPPTYPPQPRAGSSTENHPRPSVVYSFVARYPVKAHNQDVVGVLMPNRAVSGSGGESRLVRLSYTPHHSFHLVSGIVCGPGVCAVAGALADACDGIGNHRVRPALPPHLRRVPAGAHRVPHPGTGDRRQYDA